MSRSKCVPSLAMLLLLGLACFCQQAAMAADKSPVAVDQARLLKGTDDPNLWAHYGGSYNEQRFSPLKAVNADNVKNLGLAWFSDYDTNQNQHGSPLYVDGVLYVSTARNVVHAFDAHNGKRLWTYTPLIFHYFVGQFLLQRDLQHNIPTNKLNYLWQKLKIRPM